MLKKPRYILLILVFLLCIIAVGFKPSDPTETAAPDFISHSNLINLRYPQERLYLHVDRQTYFAGDDIWYKSYLLNSAIPDCNLYVELINSSGSVILKNISWSQGGFGYGDFHLPDTLSSGKYQLRAYTSWMRNFDSEWFFRKNLIIWNLLDRELQNDREPLNPKKVDLQFFPEGGTFVANLRNRVAFKAIDENGNGLDVEGVILDDRGRVISNFKSTHKGIGSFEIEPESGIKYKANLYLPEDIRINFDLPGAVSEGVIMRIESDYEKAKISLAEQAPAAESVNPNSYLLVAQARGLVFFQKEILLQNDKREFVFDKSALPQGILKFTLFGENMIPLCERLLYNNQHKYIDVKMEPDKAIYRPREKVQLNINAQSSSGQAELSNLSVAVINTQNELQVEAYPNNILSYFLLDAELRGRIEDPAFYFKDDSISTQQALDNLMLSHGYRYFEWEEIREDQLPDIVFRPEDCIQLGGTVKSIFFDKPVPDCKVSMITLKSLLETATQKTDSNGHFVFTDMYFNDTMTVLLQTINPNGKRNSYIELDKKSAKSPAAEVISGYFDFKPKIPTNSTTYLNDLRVDLINKKWSLNDTILLGDVTISRRKTEKKDDHMRFYGEADFVVEMDKLDGDMYNVFDAIDGKFPGVRYDPFYEGFSFRNKPVLLYMDGMQVDNDILSSLPGNAFDKIELIKMGIFAGVNYDGAILFFYTKSGSMYENPNRVGLGMESTDLIGYSVFRKFYSPEHGDVDNPSQLKDYRSTLYWNPMVITDSTGIAQVEFYNSDDFGEMQIIVEGLTGEGKLCRGIGKYRVSY